MTTTQADVLRHRQQGAWKKLERIAIDIVADAERKADGKLHPLLGGGTRVMLELFYRAWLLTARDLFDWWAIETKSAAAIPHEKLAALLETKYEATATALNAMLQSPAAAEAWDAVQAPNKPPFRDAVHWAIGRLAKYRDMTE